MILLAARELSRQFEAQPLFRHVTFDVRPGDKIGLVGPNGTGKTTLLNILAGLDDPDVGQVERHPSTDVALLEQELDLSRPRTLLEEARAGLAHLYELQEEAARLADTMAAESDSSELEKHHRRYDFLQQELHRLDAYNIDHRVDEVLAGLGFTPDQYDRPLSQFSGGQQNRVLLARLLLQAPTVMLLDEPTNHLDIAATEWLEEYLSRSNQTMILVSHDRYFLDRVTTRILEMFQGKVTDYRGNFSAYWRQREERNEVLRKTYEKQQEFIAKTEDFIRRNKYGQKHAQAADRVKKLERLEQVELPQDVAMLPMAFGQPTRTGDWVIDATEISKGFGTPLFSDFTVRVQRGDQIGILGPNGSGKTTLLRTLIGELPPDSGAVRFGAGVKLAYYDQQLTSVDPDVDAVEAVRPPGDLSVTPGKAREILARFGMRGDLALQKVGNMSGGEKSRVALARVAALNANVLILDEPTNHLDLWARASLETALKEFPGTLLFVSHDRYFLDRIATSIIVLGPERWRYYEGNYSDYLESLKRRHLPGGNGQPASLQQPVQETPKPAERQAKKKETRRKRRFPYRKVADLEAEIAEKEELLERLQQDLADPDVNRDGQRVKETMAAFEETQMELETLYEHWDEAVELN